MEIHLKKVHGSGNTFFLLDDTQLSAPLAEEELRQLAVQLTDPENTVLGGADGLLLVTQSQAADCLGKMRVINEDGSEASMCGNGLRTVARYLAEKYQTKHFAVETLQAPLAVEQAPDLAKGVAAFQVEIGPVSFDLATLPAAFPDRKKLFNEEVPVFSERFHFPMTQRFTAVSVPNPHLVSFVPTKEDCFSPNFEAFARFCNGENPYFPDGVNVSFAYIMEENQLFVRTYERGVGFTNACGTAMTATSFIYTLLAHPAEKRNLLTVYNPGGVVQVSVRQEEKVRLDLIGNATFIADVFLVWEAGRIKTIEKIKATNEQSAWEDFLNLRK